MIESKIVRKREAKRTLSHTKCYKVLARCFNTLYEGRKRDSRVRLNDPTAICAVSKAGSKL